MKAFSNERVSAGACSARQICPTKKTMLRTLHTVIELNLRFSYLIQNKILTTLLMVIYIGLVWHPEVIVMLEYLEEIF